VFERTRPRQSHKPPGVLSPQEVRALLSPVEHPMAHMCLRLISACGLRLTEGTPLQVSDIAPQRLLVLVRQGQGGKDRDVPLAERTLERLRAYWQITRTRTTSGACSGSWVCGTPGPGPSPTIHTGTAWCRPVGARRTTNSGGRLARRTSCRCGPSLQGSAVGAVPWCPKSAPL
jgi:integrase